MKRPFVTLFVGMVLVLGAGALAEQLHFGYFAFSAVTLLAGVLATLTDRTAFYGTGPPKSRRARP